MNAFDINAYLEGNSNGLIWDMELKKRLDDEMCIERYGFKVYSQNDEDGIIEEIFARIGTTNKKFIEFGVQDGVESNGHYLLLKGWSGFWIECDENYYKEITEKFKFVIGSGRLIVAKEFITKDNINKIFIENGQNGEIDLLSIDIDGNDYHIWKAINVVNPRVVVMEYNAKIPPSCEWVMPYCEQHMWDGGDKHGASLLALEKLAQEKGYTLVGTNISGINAFFVRNDCVEQHFCKRNVRDMYNPPRYYKKFYSGHPSFYCLSELPEGRKQLFGGVKGKILYYDGFYGQEATDSNIRWMSKRDAVLWIQDEDNKISAIRLYVEAPAFALEEQAGPRTIKCKVENGETVLRKLAGGSECFSLNIQRENCRNDEVLEVKLQIDNLWCPQKMGVGEDNRTLGILLTKIECQ